jgi:hypothetical protein
MEVRPELAKVLEPMVVRESGRVKAEMAVL